MKKFTLFLFVGFFSFLTSTLSQELDPLLKILIEKKVITYEEALSVQKEYDKKKEEMKKETKTVVNEETKELKSSTSALKGLKIGGLYFISYQNGNNFDSSQEDYKKSYNKFVLKRGYLDLGKEFNSHLNARFTTDLTLDPSGDYKVRMKFLYADFHYKGNGYFSDPHIKLGLVPFAWFGMEESINIYRLQDEMFLDRLGMATTADFGASFEVNFGDLLPKEYLENVSKSYPGKWGSFEIGIYNGSSFKANEKNSNKVVASRVSIRPLPSLLTGFQFHLFGIYGKGNIADGTRYDKEGIFKGRKIYPDWKNLSTALSYQHEKFNMFLQYFEGVGSYSGTNYYKPENYLPNLVSLNDIFKGYYQKGYSFFSDIRIGDKKRWSAMVRFDYYDPDTKNILKLTNNEDVQKRYIGGVAYRFYEKNFVLLDYQKVSHSKYIESGTKIPDEDRWQLTLQLKF